MAQIDLKFNEIGSLEPNTLLELFELDVSNIYTGASSQVQTSFYFHGYPVLANQNNISLYPPLNPNPSAYAVGLPPMQGFVTTPNLVQQKEMIAQGVLLWNGKYYHPYPLEVSGFELNGEGALPRPKIRASNIFPFFKDLSRVMNGMTGATVNRTRVFYKYLDGQSTSDPNGNFEIDSFVINRKTTENRGYIEFELITSIELGDLKLPRRQVINATCPWQYRGEGCGYGGTAINDVNNNNYGIAGNGLPFEGLWQPGQNYTPGMTVAIEINGLAYYYLCTTAHTSSYQTKFSPAYWIADECSKTIAGCRLRFPGQPLPFGGFPSTQIT